MLFNLNEILVIVAVEAFLIFLVVFRYFSLKSEKQSHVVHDLESELQHVSQELSEVESSEHEIDVTKTSFIGEQIRKVEALEAELEKRQNRVEDTMLIAQKANMAKHEFLSNVKYEIYTPLNTIVMNTESLGKALKDKKLLNFAKKYIRLISQTLTNV